MSKYRLVYFNLRGRAEPIRWILAVAKQPYEDERIDKDSEWPGRKGETRYGKVPVMFVDGKPLSQSVAICRYLGRRHGFSVDDPWKAAEGDEVADAVHDLLPHAVKIIHSRLAGNTAESQFLVEEFNTGLFRTTMKELEKKLEDKTWFCGEQMTWVDIFAACYLSQLRTNNDDAFAMYPRVKSLIDKVVNLSEIQKWKKERPVTPL